MTSAGNIKNAAYGYEQIGLSGKGAARGLGLAGFGGYGANGGYGGYGGYGAKGLGLLGGHSPGPLSAAIHTRRTYAVVPVALHQEPAVPQIIDVEPTYQPVKIIFRSLSSPVLVQQIHTPGEPGQSESTHSEDEPHRVIHEVLRPVIQEVREVIQPYRKVTQEIRPVLEEVHTRVAKGEGRYQQTYAAPIAAPIANSLQLDAGSALDAGLTLGDAYGKGLSSGLALSADNGYKSKSAKKAAK